jgi:hypothetical protein
MANNKEWLNPENAKTCTGVYQFHIIKDVIKFLRENGIDDESISYVRRGLSTKNIHRSEKDRMSCGWTETPENFIAYSSRWYKGEYRAIVFTGSKKEFVIPNCDPRGIELSTRQVVKVVPDSRKHTRSGKLVPERLPVPPYHRFADIDVI